MTPEEKFKDYTPAQIRTYKVLEQLIAEIRREAYEDAATMCEDQDLPIMADLIRARTALCPDTEGDGK